MKIRQCCRRAGQNEADYERHGEEDRQVRMECFQAEKTTSRSARKPQRLAASPQRQYSGAREQPGVSFRAGKPREQLCCSDSWKVGDWNESRLVHRSGGGKRGGEGRDGREQRKEFIGGVLRHKLVAS